MRNEQLSGFQPAGIDLFLGIEGLAEALTAENELLITGGLRRSSISSISVQRNRRRVVVRRRRRRVVRRRNVSTT